MDLRDHIVSLFTSYVYNSTMSHLMEIELGYAAGNVNVRFEGDTYPENWNSVVEEARMAVQEQLFEIADIHEWRSSFETAQEYSMPGMSPEPNVGTIHVEDSGDFVIDLDIESIHDCDWDSH